MPEGTKHTDGVQIPGRRRPGRMLLVLLLVVGGTAAAGAAPGKPGTLIVLGHAADAGRMGAAALAARTAAEATPRAGPLADGITVELVDDGGTPAGFAKALKHVRARKPVGILALPTANLEPLYWKAAAKLPVPWVTLTGRSPSPAEAPDFLFHLGPTPVAQAIVAADSMIAPLAARRVGIVQEPTQLGVTLAAAFGRNLSSQVTFAGTRVWEADADAGALGGLRGLEADWLYVAMAGAPLHHFIKTLAASAWRPQLFFADGARDASLLAAYPAALEGCVFLDGPDPEMHGRLGEALVDAFERADKPLEAVSGRAYEAARRVLGAVATAESTKLKPVLEALDAHRPKAGALGSLRFDRSGALRVFPPSWWRVQKGRYEVWPGGLLPTPGCGPPLGFGRPRMPTVNARGKVGYLTWGSADKRTIEADLLALGLSTGGKDAELDALVRDEILGRAIRIANRLFRREADGTPTPGWSWGMALTAVKPSDEIKRGSIWLAVCAGDHEGAGGQAFGSWVAVYTTFLKRTMYISRKLDPVLTSADRKLLDGTYRWGEDRGANFRADKIRCLMDGFASAMGLTLSHEYGHCCGCGHDTEHPTSIMNVVAGAGASWEDAVWIPKHQKKVTSALGIEPLVKERRKKRDR